MAVNHLPGRKGPTLLPISPHKHPIPCPLIHNQVVIDVGPDKSPGGLHTSLERSKAQEEVRLHEVSNNGRPRTSALLCVSVEGVEGRAAALRPLLPTGPRAGGQPTCGRMAPFQRGGQDLHFICHSACQCQCGCRCSRGPASCGCPLHPGFIQAGGGAPSGRC